MRKLLISTVILFGFFIMFLILKNNHSNIPEIDVSNPNLIEIPFSKNEIVNRINNKNKKINSILIKNMPIKAKNGRMTFKLTGDLAHNKDKFFRFIVTSKITGKEMDIGSNNDIFWFWSKRISPPALYFSKHEDLWKTNLKTPLNPAWMIESLNINLIDQNNISSISEDGVYLYLREKRKTAAGDDCVFITVIHKKSETVWARKLIDLNGNGIVSTFYSGENIIIDWKDENASMEWDTTNKELNVNLSNSMWQLPKYKNKINMGE